jgi:hypothetical protein
MLYRLLTDVVVIAHFLWILFLIFGLAFAMKRSRIAWVHLGGLLFTLLINIVGWFCPLTYLENYLRSRGYRSPYEESFILYHLGAVIYPQLSEAAIRLGGIVFVCVNLVGYAFIARRYYS